MLNRPFRSFSRQNITLRPLKRRLKIITDGQETEKNYFEDLNKISFNILDVTAKNTDIDKLVDMAIKYKESGNFDEVYVVCDIDERLKTKKSAILLNNALGVAKQHGVKVCLSNQSFDIWILAHFDTVPSAAQNRTEANRLLRQKEVMAGANFKHLQAQYVTEANIDTALRNCKQLKNTYYDIGGILNASGPVTDVDELVQDAMMPPSGTDKSEK